MILTYIAILRFYSNSTLPANSLIGDGVGRQRIADVLIFLVHGIVVHKWCDGIAWRQVNVVFFRGRVEGRQ